MDPSDSWTSGRPEFARVSAAEAVLADLRGAIEKGELAVGTRLPSEAALATRYGVSRSVVREALRSCETLGLTRTQTGRGTFVVADHVATDLTIGEFSSREIAEARPHVEIPAAGLAARNGSADARAELRRLADEMNRVTDPPRWVKLDGEFHAAIARAADNRLIAAWQATMRAALLRQSETLNLVAHRRDAANAEHAAIVDAIEAGDAPGAQTAMAEHLDRVRDALERLRG